MQLIYFFLFCFILQSPFSLSAAPASHYLNGRMVPTDRRYPSFEIALKLLKKRHAKVVIETGTARCGDKNIPGDGGSTLIFGEWAKDYECDFYTVDIDPKAIAESQNAVGPNPYVHFVCQDSLAFLSAFDQPVDFIYLDSYDYDVNDPLPSQIHHLNEIIAIYPKLKPKAFVMIDDCDLPFGGKGALVIPFLLEKGWTILYQGYQVILVRS